MGISSGGGKGPDAGRSEDGPRLHFVRSDALLCAPEDKQQIELNNYRSVELYLYTLNRQLRDEDTDQNPFSNHVLCTLHAKIVEGLYGCGGHIRQHATDQVEIHASFTPHTPAEISYSLPELLDFCRCEVVRIRELPQSEKRSNESSALAAYVLHRFMVIHPFRGGNGRVGRALLDLLLSQLDVIVHPMTLLYYCGRRRDEYFRCLHSADAGDPGPMEAFVMRGVAEAQIDTFADLLDRTSGIPVLSTRIKLLRRDFADILEPSTRSTLDDRLLARRFSRLLKSAKREIDKASARLGFTD